LTPNRAAILRTPSVRPGLSRAARMAFSTSAGIGGRAACPHPWLAQGQLAHAPGSLRARTPQRHPSSETSPCLPASWCRGLVDVGTGQYAGHAARTGAQPSPGGCARACQPTRPSPCRIADWQRPGIAGQIVGAYRGLWHQKCRDL
jgi:hypothetical protein